MEVTTRMPWLPIRCNRTRSSKIRIKCMLKTIDRTRSGTSNKFWQGIKQSNGTPPETIIGKCASSTNVYMRDNTISSSTIRMGAYYGF